MMFFNFSWFDQYIVSLSDLCTVIDLVNKISVQSATYASFWEIYHFVFCHYDLTRAPPFGVNRSLNGLTMHVQLCHVIEYDRNIELLFVWSEYVTQNRGFTWSPKATEYCDRNQRSFRLCLLVTWKYQNTHPPFYCFFHQFFWYSIFSQLLKAFK